MLVRLDNMAKNWLYEVYPKKDLYFTENILLESQFDKDKDFYIWQKTVKESGSEKNKDS